MLGKAKHALTVATLGLLATLGLAGSHHILIKRFAHPDEVASLVAYVASPLSSATTGAALRVDGGVVKSAF